MTYYNITKLRELLYSNCGADVPEYAKYAIGLLVLLMDINNHTESNVRVCAPLK